MPSVHNIIRHPATVTSSIITGIIIGSALIAVSIIAILAIQGRIPQLTFLSAQPMVRIGILTGSALGSIAGTAILGTLFIGICIACAKKFAKRHHDLDSTIINESDLARQHPWIVCDSTHSCFIKYGHLIQPKEFLIWSGPGQAEFLFQSSEEELKYNTVITQDYSALMKSIKRNSNQRVIDMQQVINDGLLAGNTATQATGSVDDISVDFSSEQVNWTISYKTDRSGAFYTNGKSFDLTRRSI